MIIATIDLSIVSSNFEVSHFASIPVHIFEAMVKVKQLASSRIVLGLSLDLFQPAGFTRLPG